MLHFSTALTAEAGNEGRLPSCHLPLFPPVLSYWRKWYTVITTHKTNVYTAYWLGKPLLDTQCRVLVKAWAKVPQWNIETPNLYLFYPTNKRLRCYYLGLSWWLRQERICLQCRGPRFDPWVGKISWRREWLPTLGIVAWEIPWTEEPGWLQSVGSQRVGHEWMTNTVAVRGSSNPDVHLLCQKERSEASECVSPSALC